MITPADPVGQDVVCGHESPQPSLDLSLTPVELSQLQRLKAITSDQIARSLLVNGADSLRRESDRLYDCSENVQLKSNGRVTTHGRCKRRLCALCSSIEASKWSKDLTSSMDHLDFDMVDEVSDKHNEACEPLPKTVALKLTLNAGQACPLPELKTVIRKVLHLLWPRMLKIRAVAPHLKGAFRSTEITVSDEPMIDGLPLMNPHIHGALILQIPEDRGNTWREWLDELSVAITHYWKRAVRRQLSKLSYDRSITASSQLVEPLHTQQREHLAGWLSYCAKGAVKGLAESLHREDYTASALIPVARIWETVDATIKGIRLIATSGIIRDALDEARDEDKRAKTEHQERMYRDDEPRITHRWSFTLNRYIKIDEYIAERDKPPLYRTKLFQAHYRDRELPEPDELKRNTSRDEVALLQVIASRARQQSLFNL